MTDIFQHWKQSRFIVAPTELVDGDRLVVLSDVQYWVDHIDALFEWCRDRDANVSGMTVVFGSERTLMEFVLKWS